MHKGMLAAASLVVMLVVAGLAAGSWDEVADALAVETAQVAGVEPCNTSVSGAPSMLCGTSTDPATWWNAAGITGPRGAEWHTQPTFFPPDVAYTRWAIPMGDERFAALSGQRIKRYINDITGISRKSRDDGNQYWGRLTGSEYDHMTTDYVAEQLRRVGVEQVRLQRFEMPPQWWPTS